MVEYMVQTPDIVHKTSPTVEYTIWLVHTAHHTFFWLTCNVEAGLVQRHIWVVVVLHEMKLQHEQKPKIATHPKAYLFWLQILMGSSYVLELLGPFIVLLRPPAVPFPEQLSLRLSLQHASLLLPPWPRSSL